MRPDVRVDPDSVRLERTTDESPGTYRVLAGTKDSPVHISDSCCPTPAASGMASGGKPATPSSASPANPPAPRQDALVLAG
jgi:hypothetical protein